MCTKNRFAGIGLALGGCAAAALLAAAVPAAQADTFGLQFAPAQGYTAYTGWASNVTAATFTPPLNFNATNTTVYTLGSSGATFTITGGNYNVGGASGPTTNISYLTQAFFLGRATATPTTLTATLTGVSAADRINFNFLQSVQTGFEPAVSVNGSTPVAINSDTTFVNAGTFSGSTSYSLTFTNAAGPTAGEFDLSGGLISITPAPEPAAVGLLAVGAIGLLLLKRRPA